jgi:predicted ATPase
MRVNYLQLSNILSFKYEEDINSAFKIEFDPDLNIIIGGNGSGKSTALEAMNFVFTRVLFKCCEFDEYSFKRSIVDRKHALKVDDRSNHTSGLRLQPNWDSELGSQSIRILITLDDIDKANINHIANNYGHIRHIFEVYSYINTPEDFVSIENDMEVDINITFNYREDRYETSYTNSVPKSVQFYLEYYQAINEAITIHNNEHTNYIAPLGSTFSMLSAFRNYNTFSLQTSLQPNPVSQLREIRRNSSYRSNHDQSGSEPAIFNIVKLKLGEEYLNFLKGTKDIDEAKDAVNRLKMVNDINDKLELLNLKFYIELTDLRTWSYEFRFYDTKNERDLGDINSLSAGQKSIMHLIFEAYGRDDVNGGLIIIDEPEIHLHYQFQFEYLKILEKLAKEQGVQYIIVTHSEGFISNKTIGHVKRFSLNEERNSVVCTPDIREDQRKLIEILNNTWAARVLFLDRVLLVEGQDDEYFFRVAIKKLQPDLSQNITVYGVRGKDSISSFKSFFESFGLTVYLIKDLDATGKDFYNSTVSFKYDKRTKQAGLDKRKIDKYRNEHPDLDQQIESKYSSDEFYLKKGAIEQYTEKPKGIVHVINFCENEMDNFLNSDDEKAKEICKIIGLIANKDGDSTH